MMEFYERFGLFGFKYAIIDDVNIYKCNSQCSNYTKPIILRVIYEQVNVY